ncbi:MAG: DNA alkylation repair protein [Anaeroplasmataceae bacterium]|nr:DNA alkylation repair protein [Anaeroplasmataceae bacterium]
MNLSEIKKKLIELATPKIQEFSKKLIPNSLPILGCKVPDVRKLAKEICKGDFYLFLREYDASSYELQLCYGFVIANAKMSFEERRGYIQDFVKTIQDWAVCDGFVGSLKCTKKNMQETFEFIKAYQSSKQEFEVRFLAVMLMSYFITPEFVLEACQIIPTLYIEKYYAKMGVAWFIATLMVDYPTEAYRLLEQIEDKETIHLAIRKIRESFRIKDIDKKKVLAYKK